MKFNRILKSNLPLNVQEDNLFFTEDGEIYINNNNGELVRMGGSNDGLTIQDWQPKTAYSKNSLIVNNNKIYLVLNDFESGDVFNYDVAVLFLISTRISGTAIQFWQPITNYKVDDLLFYNKMLYKVEKGFQSGKSFTKDNLSLVVTDHNATEGIQGEGIDYFHLSSEKNALLNEITDTQGKLTYKGVTTGNMHSSTYDKNNDGVVDRAETLLGLKVTVDELNNLQGAATNLQSQIEALSKGMIFKDEFQTHSELEEKGETIEGYTYIIAKDETKNNNRTYYVYQQGWYYLGNFSIETRNFKTNPINLPLETVGILSESNIDLKIARKTDLHKHDNFSLLSTYTQSEASLANAVSSSHIHEHLNVLNKFSEDGTGGLLFNGKPLESNGAGGIIDLSDFTTSDLIDSPNKRYVTDVDKTEIAKIPTINASLNNAVGNINNIINKIPSSVTASNTLITSNDLKLKFNNLEFKALNDVGIINPNELLTMDVAGNIISIPKIDSGIPVIFDKKDNKYNSISKLKFNKSTIELIDDLLTITPDNIYSTELIDMPKKEEFINNGFLVSDVNTGTYIQKSIDEFTSKLENKNIDIIESDWGIDGCEIIHGLETENIIAVAYENKVKIEIPYEILDNNTIKLLSNTPKNLNVVINSTQGTISNSAVKSSGSITITPSMFLDDNSSRIDKAYSSSKIESLIDGFVKKTSVYSKVESDSKYGNKTYEHSHNNSTVLNSLKEINGNLYYGNKMLITDFNPYSYSKKFNNQDMKSMTLLIDTSQIISDAGVKVINAAQILIQNTSIENLVHLVVNEGNITIIDIKINPGESQQYQLGISPNIKISIQGEFNASYTLTGF